MSLFRTDIDLIRQAAQQVDDQLLASKLEGLANRMQGDYDSTVDMVVSTPRRGGRLEYGLPTCPNCGDEFEPHDHPDFQQYCSQACYEEDD